MRPNSMVNTTPPTRQCKTPEYFLKGLKGNVSASCLPFVHGRCVSAAIWFEILGVVDPGKKNRFFSGNFKKNFDFYRQISEKIRFFRQFKKNFEFPGKNWPFTCTSGQTILYISLQTSPLSNILPVHN